MLENVNQSSVEEEAKDQFQSAACESVQFEGEQIEARPRPIQIEVGPSCKLFSIDDLKLSQMTIERVREQITEG